MIDPAQTRLRIGQAALALAAFAVVLVLLVPFPGAPGRGLPGPDIVLCLVLAWVQRRPAEAPAWLIGLIGLFADLMLMRPPGLGAGLWVLAGESLRRRRLEGEPPFLAEWAMASGAIAALMMAHGGVLALLQVPHAPAGAIALHIVFTALAYPLVVIVARQVLGLRMATATPERDERGRLP